MHSWETMMAPANHGHNWYNNIQIKPEPIDPGYQQHTHTQVNMNNSAASPQTSPQSIDSMDSSGGQKQQLYYEQSLQAMTYNRNPLGFNPLTPPGYTGLVAPQHQPVMLPQRQTTPTRTFQGNSSVPVALTPTHTPPMDVTPPKSPKDLSHETPEKEMDTRSDCGDSYDDASIISDLEEEVIKNPRVNSHGKVKMYKCKQCNFVAVTKMSFWDHTRSHIKPEKVLNCPKCPFVTEYKHHLEYHLRNHSRSKPFQCPSCNYSCVNKSMLNSHLKSHSSVFQYRCVDCNYATKYCHSLKLHLRKYSHKPDIVLNLDGSPNPLPIIDVYGTRRGPKTKTQVKQEDAIARQNKEKEVQSRRQMKEQSMRLQRERELKVLQQQQHQQQETLQPQPLPPMMPNPLANMFQNAGSNMPLFSYFNLNFQMLAAQQQAAAMAQQLSPSLHQTNELSAMLDDSDKMSSYERSGMNLSHSIRSDSNEYMLEEEEVKDYTDDEVASEASNTPPSLNNSKNRRKGRAFKIEQTIKVEEATEKEKGEDKVREEVDRAKSQSPVNNNNNNNTTKEQQCQTTDINSTSIATTKVFECKFCDISFKDDVLYTIHMGYHGYNDVFKCNMCGEKCDDRVTFFLHIARSSHQ